jgi:NADH dehydrogenase [ubiquinone] 1 alpha subcomplex assembly factor 7
VTPLGEALAARIRADGPMTVADYMAACLGDPRFGYYTTREPFGAGGDFVTAPEVSQMFGELIGLWAVATWQAMGSPSPFVLAELGPGRGTLMADALRAARIRPEFAAAVRVNFIETSPRLRAVQAETLSGVDVAWRPRIDDLPEAPAIFIANEFFDALPIRQFVRTVEGWAERMVGLGDDGQLAFGLRPAEFVAGLPERPVAQPQPVAIRETCAPAAGIMAALAGHLSRWRGAALVIDYGYQGPAFGDTLQAVRGHAYDDPLAAPGEADLTAHVDFAALAKAARAAGAKTRPLVTQREFLMRLGLRERAERLGRDKDSDARARLASEVERLAGPDAMGTLFKVQALSSHGLALPAFDDDSQPRSPEPAS